MGTKMKCHECFHYHACGHAGRDVDTEMCKNALPTKDITDLKEALKKAQDEIKNLKIELEYATDCIDEVEDALNRGNHNDWAESAINEYRSRHDDSL